eukprot:COSAG03_NODE_983_length_5114_cov_18.281555_3_plen_119_part_00
MVVTGRLFECSPLCGEELWLSRSRLGTRTKDASLASAEMRRIEVHRLFEKYGGVYRGWVLSYDDETKWWKVQYECDATAEEYDKDDMESYLIRRIDGEAPADGDNGSFCSGNDRETLL